MTVPDNSLGAFLRSRRERLDPVSLGLAGTTRRRTPGLRREEVARRANLSVEWYSRLEQGRGGTPSVQVLSSVADALLLTPAEREHLLLLAQQRQTGAETPEVVALDPRFRRVLDGFAYGPAYIKTAAWDIVAWNRAAQLVLTDYPALAERDRNVLKIMFLDPKTRELLAEWETEAALTVSTFRRELTRWGAADRQAADLVTELRARSPEFARMWAAQDVGSLGEGVKHLAHPEAGKLAMWYSSYAIDDEPGLGLVIYTPDSDHDADRIRQLLDG